MNENPLGPSPAALEAARRAIAFCHRYPDQQEQALKRCLAHHLNVSPEHITLGNGSDDLLTQIVSIYLQKKNSALLAQHSFLGLQKILENAPGQLKRVTLSFANMAIEPFLAAIDATTRLLFIVNPNNPTGHYFNTQQLESLLQQVPPTVLVIIDEAYAEYATAADYPHTFCWMNRYPNLIVSRTFSKFYGLAGLRLGYTISQPAIAHRLQQNRLLELNCLERGPSRITRYSA
ncbi:pyridoxal phosphate-dependent aminotransferase [Rickettsiella massiliensis]|uniref:pyridoxal phosphate-dependent aminotransferase n=1 Tax=Rickettsiella massiliensis TaxID=676517 RepID=UPI0002D9ADC0|nr:histidinol-phosphate transaminase [Rickettsiella massiliensis]